MTEQVKILPVVHCGAVGTCMSHPSSYKDSLSGYGEKTIARAAAVALRKLEEARQVDIATHEKNLPAIESNKAIAASIVALNEAVGMPKSWSERDRSSRARYPKSITHKAGYLLDVERHCKVDDGFASATQTYERMLPQYQAYAAEGEREKEQAARRAELEHQALVERRKADMELAGVLLRYSLPLESSWAEVLEALRTRHQRLDLAVAMAQTRGDWSEGPYRVRDALDRFTIATDEDKAIANDVIDCLRDFEDGRVFRDTTWNYDRLYAAIEDTQLVADTRRAAQLSQDA